ncbi:fimbria/pilus outer membrane usher protein [Enterobacter sp. UPMP2052]
MKKIFHTGLLIFATSSAVAKMQFDQEMLKSLGYNADTAELILNSGNYLPGEHRVNIIVNGQSKGVYDIYFDRTGLPCWSDSLLHKLGVDPQRFDSKATSCLKPTSESGISITENVSFNSLELKIPIEGLMRNIQYAKGGNALVVNYDGRRYQYAAQAGESNSTQTLMSEIGMNFDNWIFRSAQSYTNQGSQSTLTRRYGFIQRSFPDWNSLVQAGEISSNDPLFPGISLTGAQLVPENAIQGGMNHVALHVMFSQHGTAEVWQNKILLKSFSAIPGVNILQDIPALNQSDDFIVINHNVTGGVEKQVIPFIQAETEMSQGWTGTSLVIGRLRLAEQNDFLLIGSTDIFHNSWLSLIGGGVAGQRYKAASWLANGRFTNNPVTATLSQTWSFTHSKGERGDNEKGVINQISIGYPLASRLALTASANFRSNNYIDINSSWSETTKSRGNGKVKSQYSAGLNYSHNWLGAFTFTGTQSQTSVGSHTLGYTVSWGRTFGKTNFNLGIQQNRLINNKNHTDNRYIYLSISIPLGHEINLRNWVNQRDKQSLAGIGYDQVVSDKLNWSISAEKAEKQDSSLSSSAIWTTKYTQLSGGGSKSNNSNSYNVGLRGGVVIHKAGLIFTPRQINDTFGIISLNNNIPDVEVMTSSGKVWTNDKGLAVASWRPWEKNTVQVDMQTLPKNIQVPNGILDITPYHGAVVPVALPAFSVRRALLNFHASGPAPGSPVTNSSGSLVAFVNEDGTLFIDDLPEGNFYSHLPDGSPCVIKLSSPWRNSPGSLYTTISSRCIP